MNFGTNAEWKYSPHGPDLQKGDKVARECENCLCRHQNDAGKHGSPNGWSAWSFIIDLLHSLQLTVQPSAEVTSKCRYLTIFKAMQTPSITKHTEETTIPKLRKTMAAVSWRRSKGENTNERALM